MDTEKYLDVAFGVGEGHIDFDSLEAPVHRELVAPLRALKQAAAEAGFELMVASGFRSFERQSLIWNGKATGQRPMVDKDGAPLDPFSLSDIDRIYAILRWSALPGASRHHWGTEIDVYELSSMPDGYQLQLTPEETRPGGVFAHFYAWLDGYLAGQDPFYRPYQYDLGGVAPEAWHLSFGPLASAFEQVMTLPRLRGFLEQQEFALKETVLAHLEDIYVRFVTQITPHDSVGS